MRSPCVRLSLKGQTLAEIPFDGETLRIGRMKENDVVIHNLSVSRFHATLTREGDTFVIQDSGSENGIYVNGARHSRAVVGPGDRILIGKHEIEILLEGAADAAAPAGAAAGSDAWDASNTYFVGVDTQAKMLRGAEVAHDADTDGEPIVAGSAAVEPAPANDAGAPEMLLDSGGLAEEPETLLDSEELAEEPETLLDSGALGEEPETVLVAHDEAEALQPVVGSIDDAGGREDVLEAGDEAQEPETMLLPEEDAEPDTMLLPSSEEADAGAEAELFGRLDEGDPLPDPTSEYDVGAADLETAEPAPAAAADEGGGTHAGLIISRRGRFERVLRWDAERLCLGRAVECDVVLSAAEVSRNHTLLVRDGEHYEVRDLESINGTWVNGEKISRQRLDVGDVIRIDEFELTFVLEDRPIGNEIVAQAPEEIHAVPSGDAQAFTQIGEMLDLAPFAVGGSEPATEASAMSFDDPPSGEPPTVLLDDDTAGRAAGVAGASPVDPDGKPDTQGVWRLELQIRLDELPEPLREALRTLEESELRLPVELSLKTDG